MQETQIHIVQFGGEAGERTLNALKQIVNIARNSSEVKLGSALTIKENETAWKIDNFDKNYISKQFSVTALSTMTDYELTLTGDIVEGMKITDINNNEKNIFSSNETFKIIIPITNIERDGKIDINVKSKVLTKPVLYGISENSNLQNVALTGEMYEDGIGNKTEYYFKNETKIIILKQNQETKEILSGVKFEILDENKQVIYADLSTDENGEIKVENLLPGKYYIKEIQTLQGYDVYDKQIEVDLKLNEEIKVTINNLKNEIIPKVEKTNTELEVEQIQTQKEIKQEKVETKQETKQEEVKYTKIKLPKTGM